MNTVKKLIKSGLYYAAPLLGRHRIAINRQNLLILTYHRILPLDDPRTHLEQPGMYVTPDTFAKQIKILKKYFTFTKLAAWLEQAQNQSQTLPKRCCAITFDDGWQDNYEYAFPVLKQEHVPATIFLVSSMIGSHYDFWPGRLARLLHYTAQHRSSEWAHPVFDWLKAPSLKYAFGEHMPTSGELDQLINHCKHYSDTDNQNHIDIAAQHLVYNINDSDRNLLDEQEIKTMLRSDLVDIGSHTAHHIRMSEDLNPDCLKEELIDSKQQLEGRFGVPVRLFCYPNGDTSTDAINIVKQHYLGACTTRRGWNNPSTSAHALNRISIHEDMTSTQRSLLTKINGWL